MVTRALFFGVVFVATVAFADPVENPCPFIMDDGLTRRAPSDCMMATGKNYTILNGSFYIDEGGPPEPYSGVMTVRGGAVVMDSGTPSTRWTTEDPNGDPVPGRCDFSLLDSDWNRPFRCEGDSRCHWKSGLQTQNLRCYDDAELFITGGAVWWDDAAAEGRCNLTMHDGLVTQGLGAFDEARVFLYGGQAAIVHANDDATIHLYGLTIALTEACGKHCGTRSRILTDGNWSRNDRGGTMYIHGSQFKIDGVAQPFGEIPLERHGGILTGRLSYGHELSAPIILQSEGNEPGRMILVPAHNGCNDIPASPEPFDVSCEES